jgi:hypothetical protein
MPAGVRAALGRTAVGLACAAVVASGASGSSRMSLVHARWRSDGLSNGQVEDGDHAGAAPSGSRARLPRRGRGGGRSSAAGTRKLGPEERWRPASTLLSPPCSLGCS